MFIDLHLHNKETSLFRTTEVAQRGLNRASFPGLRGQYLDRYSLSDTMLALQHFNWLQGGGGGGGGEGRGRLC